MLLKHFEILAGSVKDLDRLRFADQGPDAIPIKFRKRIDTHCLLGSGHLEQAKPGEEGAYPLEFCIHAQP